MAGAWERKRGGLRSETSGSAWSLARVPGEAHTDLAATVGVAAGLAWWCRGSCDSPAAPAISATLACVSFRTGELRARLGTARVRGAAVGVPAALRLSSLHGECRTADHDLLAVGGHREPG